MDDEKVYPAGGCKCEGCSNDHPRGEKCTDPSQVVIGFAGDLLRGVCLECALELIKRLL